jgi:hypothetical protein
MDGDPCPTENRPAYLLQMLRYALCVQGWVPSEDRGIASNVKGDLKPYGILC